MQAIVTKYVGPGNVRGARIIAKCEAGRVSIPYPHELSGEAVHRAAAVALCDKLDAEAVTRRKGAEPERRFWDPAELIGGGLPNDAGYCFVFAPEVDKLREALRVARKYINQAVADGALTCCALPVSNILRVIDGLVK
jgi:hypothetical protein